MKSTNSVHYRSDLTPNPGPGGSPLRLVSSPNGSAANRPLLQQKTRNIKSEIFQDMMLCNQTTNTSRHRYHHEPSSCSSETSVTNHHHENLKYRFLLLGPTALLLTLHLFKYL
jgi:hypothetical protein